MTKGSNNQEERELLQILKKEKGILEVICLIWLFRVDIRQVLHRGSDRALEWAVYEGGGVTVPGSF